MRIIDAHMHLGEDIMFGTDDSEDVLISSMDALGIDAQVVQPGIVARNAFPPEYRRFLGLSAHPVGMVCTLSRPPTTGYWKQHPQALWLCL